MACASASVHACLALCEAEEAVGKQEPEAFRVGAGGGLEFGRAYTKRLVSNKKGWGVYRFRPVERVHDSGTLGLAVLWPKPRIMPPSGPKPERGERACNLCLQVQGNNGTQTSEMSQRRT